MNRDSKIPQVITEFLYITEIYAGGDAKVMYTEIKNGDHGYYKHE